jgi:hypothetical protein
MKDKLSRLQQISETLPEGINPENWPLAEDLAKLYREKFERNFPEIANKITPKLVEGVRQSWLEIYASARLSDNFSHQGGQVLQNVLLKQCEDSITAINAGNFNAAKFEQFIFSEKIKQRLETTIKIRKVLGLPISPLSPFIDLQRLKT